MSVSSPNSRRYFTDAARAAALEVRRENAALKTSVMTPALFIVRQNADSQLFGWEIRRFGGVLLRRSETGYLTQVLARSAGQTALTVMCRV